MAVNHIHLGGMPTKIDVNRLLDMWPISGMKPGDTFSYNDVADAINVAPRSGRFSTVTDAWRRHIERETGIRIMPDGTGTTFKVLTESEKLAAVKEKRKSLSKQGRKNLVRTGYIDRKQLTDEQRTEYDFISDNERKILAVSQLRASKQITE